MNEVHIRADNFPDCSTKKTKEANQSNAWRIIFNIRLDVFVLVHNHIQPGIVNGLSLLSCRSGRGVDGMGRDT